MFTPQNIGEESSKTAALSPEAFIWNNESYIVFSASDHVNAADQLDGNIWVARVPPQEAWLPDWSRQINERVGTKAVRRRAEGEVYEVTGGGGNPARPVIYYSMFEDRIDDLDNPCHYDPLTQQLEIMTLRRAEVCPPNVTTGVCSGQQ